MTASPALQAAIRAGCEIGTRCDYPACGGSCPSRVTVTCALRSLAAPTPEILHHIAVEVRRRQFARTRTGRAFDETVPPTEPELDNARAALTAYWSSILGEKP